MIARVFDLPDWLLIAAVMVISAGIVIPLTARSIKLSEREHDNVNVAGWALGFVGGSFIFAGTFTTVTVWDVEQSHVAAIMTEFGAATTFAQDLRTVDPEFSQDAQQILADYADIVEDRELDEITGLPKFRYATGDPEAQQTLDRLYYLIESAEADGTLTPTQATGLLGAYEAIAAARLHRLALRSPLPREIVLLLAVVSLATLVALGTFPAGGDPTTRWIMSITGTAIVVAVLATVIMLVSPGSDLDSRIGPVLEFRTWISTN